MISVRILCREAGGSIVDGQIEYGTETFAGQVPMIGDTILDPGVVRGPNRHEPENRRIWTVVGRVFNPRDREGVVGLIVDSRDGHTGDEAFL